MSIHFIHLIVTDKKERKGNIRLAGRKVTMHGGLLSLYIVGEKCQRSLCALVGVVSLDATFETRNFFYRSWWRLLRDEVAFFATASIGIVSAILMYSMFVVPKGPILGILHPLCGFPLLLWHFRTVGRFVAHLPTVMAGRRAFRCLILNFRRWR